MEKQPSIRLGPLEKLRSFKMEKQKSFRLSGSTSFKEKKYKESPGKRGDMMLHLAARAGNLPHVQMLLAEAGEEGAKDLVSKQNLDGETALYVAAEKGHVEVVREILMVSDLQSAGTKANSTFDAFHIAAKQGYLSEFFVCSLYFFFFSLSVPCVKVKDTITEFMIHDYSF